MFTKYPRTKHLPFSKGISNDDKVLNNIKLFEQMDEIVITEKMDGENTTLYSNHLHARSIDSKNHESRSWIKNFHSTIKQNIPESYRICGENLYAKHSIFYSNLYSYFYGFNIWENNICLSWEDTILWFNELNIICVPVLYRGVYNKKIITELTEYIDNHSSEKEGYVIRNSDSFSNFGENVAKYVRKNHVNTDKHWMLSTVIKNKLMV